MVVKVYVSGISGNKEVKKRQQRVLLILDSKNIKYEVIDIAEPGSEEQKDFMQNNSTSNGATISDPTPRHPLPPQIFNDNEYCGDYDQFDMANEVDEMEKFLKLSPEETPNLTSTTEVKLGNGNKEKTPEAENKENGLEEEQNGINEEKVDKSEDIHETEEEKNENGEQLVTETDDHKETEEDKVEKEENEDEEA